MLIRDLLQEGCRLLTGAGVDTPVIDAELLLGHCLGKSRTALYLYADESVQDALTAQFRCLVARREKREPLAYILGVQEFWSLDFLVTPDVLIPRPETEVLLEKVIACCQKEPPGDGLILDLCCGSGVIAVVLARELGRPVLGVDISMDALQVARKNSVAHGVEDLVSFMCADLFSAIVPRPLFSYVISNPPYVSQEEMRMGLQPEVDQFEPHLALDGGSKGLEIIKTLCDQALERIVPDGHVFLEIGAEQGADVSALFERKKTAKQSFSDLSVQGDYAGHDRIFYARKKDLGG